MGCIERVGIRGRRAAGALAVALGLAVFAQSASAAVLDLASLSFTQISGAGTGGVQSTGFTMNNAPAPNLNVTLSTSGTRSVVGGGGGGLITSSSRLKGGANGSTLINTIAGAQGVCAGGRGLLTTLDCGGPMSFDFTGNAINSFELGFDQSIDILSGMNIEVVHSGGTTSGNVLTLAEVGLLDVVGLGLADLSGFYLAFSGITRVTYTPSPLLDIAAVGGPVARVLIVNEGSSIAPVPLPPAGLALLAAIGGLGAVRLRRKRAA